MTNNRTHLPMTAKSFRRAFVLALLGVLAIGMVAFAAVGKPDWSLAPTPTTQTVAAGGTTTYSIQLTRLNGFKDAVALSASSLPAGVTATFAPTSIPASTTSSVNTSTLTLKTTAGTPAGNHTIVVKGQSGSTVKYTAIALVVQAAAQPNFAVVVSPSIIYIGQDDEAFYNVRVDRSAGFTGSVALSTYMLPRDLTASFSPQSVSFTATGPESATATLRIASAANAQESSDSFGVIGTGTINNSSVTRFGAVAINVEKTKPLTVGPVPGDLLFPGKTTNVDVEIGNPHKFAVRVANLNVNVEDATTSRGCSGRTNFAMTQMSASRLKAGVWIPAQSTRKLTDPIVGVAGTDLPKLTFKNEPFNQDACKNVKVTLQYAVEGRK